MAKEREKKQAKYHYVDKGCTAKEVAVLVGVTEATVSAWVARGGWKAEREARATSATSRYANLQQIISELAAERIELSRELECALRVGDTEGATDVRKRMTQIDDGVAKWNKTLESAKAETHISLSVYLDVMERIFSALRTYDEKVYLQTIAFQEHHITDISKKL